MIFAEQIYEPNAWFGQAAPLLVFLSIVTGLIGALVGRSRWKDAAEACEFRLNQLGQDLAAANASAQAKEEAIARLDNRIVQLEGVIQEVGGAKVMDAIVAQQELSTRRFEESMKKLADLFSSVHQQLHTHEQHDQERHEALTLTLEAIADRINGRRST